MYKNRNRIYQVLIMSFLLTLMFSMVAYADDAVMDILDQPRFGGAVQWVNKIGKIVDNWFMAVISFVSFFIISASCLRNVLAGAYCVFPKFWDGVHEAHQMTDQLSISSAMAGFKGATNWTSGSVTKFLMGLLPDIKVLTDFENADNDSIDYKQYFMKAIPQCALAVFVGVFIYNGLYRDVMSVTSRFGVAVADNALKSVKPDAILEQLTNITINIDYPIKDSGYGTDRIADLWHKEVVGHVDEIYDDQYIKENKIKMYNALSDWASATFAAEFAPYANTNQWEPTIDKRGSAIRTEAVNGTGGAAVTWIDTGDDRVKTACVQCPIHTLVAQGKINSTVTSEGYLYAYVTVTDGGYQQGQNGDTSVSDMTLVVGLPSSVTDGTFFPEEVRFSPTGGNTFLNGSGTFKYGDISFDIQQITTGGDGTIVMKQAGTGAVPFKQELISTGNAPTYGGNKVSRIKFIVTDDASVTAQLQCMFDSTGPGVYGKYGEDLSEKISQKKRENAVSAGASQSGGSQSNNNSEDDDDSDLEDAD